MLYSIDDMIAFDGCCHFQMYLICQRRLKINNYSGYLCYLKSKCDSMPLTEIDHLIDFVNIDLYIFFQPLNQAMNIQKQMFYFMFNSTGNFICHIKKLPLYMSRLKTNKV